MIKESYANYLGRLFNEMSDRYSRYDSSNRRGNMSTTQTPAHRKMGTSQRQLRRTDPRMDPIKSSQQRERASELARERRQSQLAKPSAGTAARMQQRQQQFRQQNQQRLAAGYDPLK